MNGTQNLPQAQAVAHGTHEFGDQLARVRSDDRHAEDAVAAGGRDHFDEAAGLTFGDGPIKIVDSVACHVDGQALRQRLGLGQANAGDLGVGEHGPWYDRVIDAEFPEATEQRVHRAIPALVTGGMSQLIRPRDVAAGKDVRVRRLQILVDGDGSVRLQFDAEFLQPKACRHGAAAGRHEDPIERDLDGGGIARIRHRRAVQDRPVAAFCELDRAMLQQHANAFGLEAPRDRRRNLGILPREEPGLHLDERDLAAESSKCLRHLATDGPTAQDEQPAGQSRQVPERVRRQWVDRVQSRDRRQ